MKFCKSNIYVLEMVILVFNITTYVLCIDDFMLNIKDICHLKNERYPDEDHTVQDILRSYKNCLNKLNEYSEDTRELLLKELTYRLQCFKEDLKQSYYAGNAQFSDVELVGNMEQGMLDKGINVSFGSLKSSNRICNNARTARSTVKHIIPLVVTGTLSEKQKACDAIFKKYRPKGGNITKLDIPTPKLDNNNDPKKLTVPLTNPSTYEVDSPEAENALTQYYKVVMKCLTLTTEHKIQVFRFNKKFYEWLTQAVRVEMCKIILKCPLQQVTFDERTKLHESGQMLLKVLPHLKDDKCYPAFGGVLRIVETMRQNDFVPKNATANFIFYRQKDMGKKEEEERKTDECLGKYVQSSGFCMILIPLIIFIFLCGVYCLLWRSGRCKASCCETNYDSDSASTDIFYYPIEETPSVSLDLDDLGPEPPISASPSTSRQRAGNESKVYSMTYEQESLLLGLPLKRQLSSKGWSSHNLSPGKRPKKSSSNY